MSWYLRLHLFIAAVALPRCSLVFQVAHFFTCNDHDLVLFLTMTGRVLGLKAWQIPAAARTAKGVPLVSLLPVSRDEAQMAAVLPVR